MFAVQEGMGSKVHDAVVSKIRTDSGATVGFEVQDFEALPRRSECGDLIRFLACEVQSRKVDLSISSLLPANIGGGTYQVGQRARWFGLNLAFPCLIWRALTVWASSLLSYLHGPHSSVSSV